MKRFIPILIFIASTAQAQVFIAKDEATAANRRMPVVLVDYTDGWTPEPTVTITGSECEVSVNGAAEVACARAACSSNCITAVAGGIFYYELDTTEVASSGYVTVRIMDSGNVHRQFVGLAIIGDGDAAFWAKAFTVNTGQTSSTAVAGSLAKESGGATSGNRRD